MPGGDRNDSRYRAVRQRCPNNGIATSLSRDEGTAWRKSEAYWQADACHRHLNVTATYVAARTTKGGYQGAFCWDANGQNANNSIQFIASQWRAEPAHGNFCRATTRAQSRRLLYAGRLTAETDDTGALRFDHAWAISRAGLARPSPRRRSCGLKPRASLVTTMSHRASMAYGLFGTGNRHCSTPAVSRGRGDGLGGPNWYPPARIVTTMVRPGLMQATTRPAAISPFQAQDLARAAAASAPDRAESQNVSQLMIRHPQG